MPSNIFHFFYYCISLLCRYFTYVKRIRHSAKTDDDPQNNKIIAETERPSAGSTSSESSGSSGSSGTSLSSENSKPTHLRISPPQDDRANKSDNLTSKDPSIGRNTIGNTSNPLLKCTFSATSYEQPAQPVQLRHTSTSTAIATESASKSEGALSGAGSSCTAGSMSCEGMEDAMDEQVSHRSLGAGAGSESCYVCSIFYSERSLRPLAQVLQELWSRCLADRRDRSLGKVKYRRNLISHANERMLLSELESRVTLRKDNRASCVPRLGITLES